MYFDLVKQPSWLQVINMLQKFFILFLPQMHMYGGLKAPQKQPRSSCCLDTKIIRSWLSCITPSVLGKNKYYNLGGVLVELLNPTFVS